MLHAFGVGGMELMVQWCVHAWKARYPYGRMVVDGCWHTWHRWQVVVGIWALHGVVSMWLGALGWDGDFRLLGGILRAQRH